MWGRWIELAVLSLALVGYLAFSRWLGEPKWAPRNEGIAGIDTLNTLQMPRNAKMMQMKSTCGA